MPASTRPLLLALVVLAAGLAGCTGDASDESVDTNGTGNGTNETLVTPPTTTTTGARAHFQVGEIRILAPEDKDRPLYEDDANATIRYNVSQPADAPGRETAFVTYILNGEIVDAQQVTLEPGQKREYERLVTGLREDRTIRVEVRAGSDSERNETSVQSWPRAGKQSLTIGPLTIRADYGLLKQDGRVLVNLTLANDATDPNATVKDFRVKMVCVDADGTLDLTRSHDLDAPTPGNRTGVDVFVDDCDATQTQYGLEFKGRDASGELWGRLLLVPEGWAPTDASGTA